MHTQTAAPSAAAATLATAATGRFAQPAPRSGPSAAVVTEFDVARAGGEIALTLRVVNNTPRTVELHFPTARTHDFTVLDERGAVVWRWSERRLFTQTMQAAAVSPRDTFTVGERWNPRGAHGTFTAVATLASADKPVTRQLTFTLP